MPTYNGNLHFLMSNVDIASCRFQPLIITTQVIMNRMTRFEFVKKVCVCVWGG